MIVRYVFGDYVIPFALRPTLKTLLFGSEWLISVPTFNFALWFLPVFLLTSCAFLLLQRIRRVSLFVAVVVAHAVLSLPLQELVPGRPSLSINVLPVAVALMGVGTLLKRWDAVRRVTFPALVAVLLVTLVVAFAAPGNVSGIRTYAFYLSAVGGFLLVARLANVVKSSALIDFVGRNSLLMAAYRSVRNRIGRRRT